MTYEEAIARKLIGIEDPYIYDGLCAWQDKATGEYFPVEGREDLFELFMDKNTPKEESCS